MWSAALAIEMLSMGSKPMAQTSGSALSSCISQEEPELDSKSTTNGTALGSGGAEAVEAAASAVAATAAGGGGVCCAYTVQRQRPARPRSEVGSAMSRSFIGAQRRGRGR